MTPRVAIVAAVLAALIFIADLTGSRWGGSSVVAGRAVVVFSAVVVAALAFANWSNQDARSGLCHAAAVAGLIGGAATTSAAVTGPSGAIFSTVSLAAFGIAGLLAAALCLSIDRRTAA